MYAIDFLPVENEDSGKSGDAIVMSFDRLDTLGTATVVVDGGFTSVGDDILTQLDTWHGGRQVDLLVSTHPDNDHINGLVRVLEECNVKEVLMHLPWAHEPARAKNMTNFKKIEELYALAVAKGVTVTEPFTGLTRFGGAYRVLGPTRDYYREQLAASLDKTEAAFSLSHKSPLGAVVDLVKRVISYWPAETLSEADDTDPRNKTSVISLVKADQRLFMLTGDAGVASLEYAADEYETHFGDFYAQPLSLFQAPHHGSHHNLSPTVLDRILGAVGAPHSRSTNAVVSSAKAAPKHPSPKVTNALGRRGANVVATEGRTICFASSSRPGWSPTTPIGPLEEPED